MNKALVVNLYAGPGALKSTTAAGVFTLLKLHGVDCDAPYEFAKDMVWEESFSMMNDQNYIFGKQSHRLWRIRNKVEVIIVDSPLLLSIVYRKEDLGDTFIKHVLDVYNQYNNLNIFIERNMDVKFVENGRDHNLKEALTIDDNVKEVLNKYGTPYITMQADYSIINNLAGLVLNKLGIKQKYKLEKN